MADVIWIDGGAWNPKIPTLSRWLMSIPVSSSGSMPTRQIISFRAAESKKINQTRVQKLAHA